MEYEPDLLKLMELMPPDTDLHPLEMAYALETTETGEDGRRDTALIVAGMPHILSVKLDEFWIYVMTDDDQYHPMTYHPAVSCILMRHNAVDTSPPSLRKFLAKRYLDGIVKRSRRDSDRRLITHVVARKADGSRRDIYIRLSTADEIHYTKRRYGLVADTDD